MSTERPKSYFEKTTYKHDSDVPFCCDDMEQAWKEGFIGFGEKYCSGLNTVNSVSIYQCSPYPEGSVWDEKEISFCPFCTEEIYVVTKLAK